MMQLKLFCSFTLSNPSCTCILSPSSLILHCCNTFSNTRALLHAAWTLHPSKSMQARPLHERLCNLCAGRVLRVVCVCVGGSVCVCVCFLLSCWRGCNPGCTASKPHAPKPKPCCNSPSFQLREGSVLFWFVWVFCLTPERCNKQHLHMHITSQPSTRLLQLSIFGIQGRFCVFG